MYWYTNIKNLIFEINSPRLIWLANSKANIIRTEIIEKVNHNYPFDQQLLLYLALLTSVK